MNEQVKISTGFKTYDICNQNGKLLCQISFNPHDTNIIDRHKKVLEELDKLKKNVAANMSKKMTVEYLKEIEDIIYKQIDYLINAEVSSELFSIMGAFSITPNGNLFVEEILDMIGGIIESETGKRVKKIKTKIQKHTSKYHN